MATGGTIAGAANSATSSGVYSAGSIGVEALIDGERADRHDAAGGLHPSRPGLVEH